MKKLLTVSITILMKFKPLINLPMLLLYPFSICSYSIPKNIEDREYLINKTKIDFNLIGSSESRIMKNRSINK